MTTLVVGRGLLGGAVYRVLADSGRRPRGVAVPWSDPGRALRALLDAADDAAEEVDRPDGAWDLVWCAGAGVVATSQEALEGEVSLLSSFLAGMERPPRAMFLASSAGGVYAGSSQPPFTETHEPRPASAYGVAKLRTEAAARMLATGGTKVAIGRFANVYGPDQDLGKPQGLVSQLCLGRVTGRPVRIYVSTDTLRDYVYVEDAAAVAVAMLDRVAGEPDSTVVVKIVASGQGTTVAELVSASTKGFRRRLPVVQAVRGDTGQVRDLRLRSRVWVDLDGLVRTPLVVGLRATAEGVAARHRDARLAVTPK